MTPHEYSMLIAELEAEASAKPNTRKTKKRHVYSEKRRLIGQEVAHARSGPSRSLWWWFHITSNLGDALDDQDRARGLPTPVHSRKNFDKATKLVRRLRRLHTLPRRTR